MEGLRVFEIIAEQLDFALGVQLDEREDFVSIRQSRVLKRADNGPTRHHPLAAHNRRASWRPFDFVVPSPDDTQHTLYKRTATDRTNAWKEKRAIFRKRSGSAFDITF